MNDAMPIIKSLLVGIGVGPACCGGKLYVLPRASQLSAELFMVDAPPRAWHRPFMLLSERVLFLDGEALVIDKPAGLPVDAPRNGALSLENHIESLKFGFKRWPTAVHRLDRDTSGCLLLARNPKAHARFQQAFEQGLVQKTYLAVLDGVPEGESGTIDLALGKVSSEEAGWRMVADPEGKRAVTHWRVINTLDDRALLEFKPETGRTHQIRVHAATGLGVPIVGDPMYGNGGKAMLLHAVMLRLEREGKKPIDATAPLPDSFTAAGFGPEPAA
jgi:tRNA pseudouridine32 synthase / 23S rRNA pseudouridine746 synthase